MKKTKEKKALAGSANYDRIAAKSTIILNEALKKYGMKISDMLGMMVFPLFDDVDLKLPDDHKSKDALLNIAKMAWNYSVRGEIHNFRGMLTTMLMNELRSNSLNKMSRIIDFMIKIKQERFPDIKVIITAFKLEPDGLGYNLKVLYNYLDDEKNVIAAPQSAPPKSVIHGKAIRPFTQKEIELVIVKLELGNRETISKMIEASLNAQPEISKLLTGIFAEFKPSSETHAFIRALLLINLLFGEVTTITEDDLLFANRETTSYLLAQSSKNSVEHLEPLLNQIILNILKHGGMEPFKSEGEDKALLMTILTIFQAFCRKKWAAK
jgi:hypothetical protein